LQLLGVWGDKYPAAVDQPSAFPQASTSTDDDANSGFALHPSELAGKPFFATGVSLVLHPRNPFVPVVHLNVRYLEAGDVSWFGGGPTSLPAGNFVEDTRHFHRVLQKSAMRTVRGSTTASRAGEGVFFIGHRAASALGGIYFDYCAARSVVLLATWRAFLPRTRRCGARRATPYSTRTARAARWARRTVEFNLILSTAARCSGCARRHVEADLHEASAARRLVIRERRRDVFLSPSVSRSSSVPVPPPESVRVREVLKPLRNSRPRDSKSGAHFLAQQVEFPITAAYGLDADFLRSPIAAAAGVVG